MIIQGILQIKKGIDREVSIMDVSGKGKEVCQVQFSTNGLPKLILSKPIVTYKGDYSALPHNYGYSFKSMWPILVF